MGVIYFGLLLFGFLGVEALPTQPTLATSLAEQKSNSTVLPTGSPPTVTNTTDSDDNSTIPILQITHYHYLDWPKIGYHIFMRKMIDAMKTLKFFLTLDPMLLKITRTYILTNDTDLDFGDSNSTEVNSADDSSPIVLPVETNTESPLKAAVYENQKESRADVSHSLKEKSTDHKTESKDDVEKVKTGGFFSTIAGAVASFYHALTGWF